MGDDACSASNSEGESDEAVQNKRASAMHLSDDECCRAPYFKRIKRDGPVAEDAIPNLHNLGRIHYRAYRYRAAIAMYACALRIVTDTNPDGKRRVQEPRGSQRAQLHGSALVSPVGQQRRRRRRT